MPLFHKRKINKPGVANVYQTNVPNLKSRRLNNIDHQATPSNKMNTSRNFQKVDKFSLIMTNNNVTANQSNEADSQS